MGKTRPNAEELGKKLIKKVVVLCLAALGAALLMVGTAPAASAYPEQTCDVTVDRQVLDPGDSFTVTGKAAGVDASNQTLPSSAFSWAFSWNGVTKHRTGAVASATFTAPHVTTTRKIRLTARSTSPLGECVRHLDITVVAASVAGPTGGGGLLPSTGGPAFWLLVAAVALLLVGGGTVIRTRRRG
jgi:LPXTG-motif cell wall-anchored protein